MSGCKGPPLGDRCADRVQALQPTCELDDEERVGDTRQLLVVGLGGEFLDSVMPASVVARKTGAVALAAEA